MVKVGNVVEETNEQNGVSKAERYAHDNRDDPVDFDAGRPSLDEDAHDVDGAGDATER